MPLDDAADASLDIRCPKCDYNLRGLTEPRCPECGFKFEWAELRDPSRRMHPYLFEHHPERNIRSFFQTLIGGLRPRRFWRSLHPAQPSNPRRLLTYFATVASVVVAAAVAVMTSVVFKIAMIHQAAARQWNVIAASRPSLRTEPVDLPSHLRASLKIDELPWGSIAIGVLLPIIWPTATCCFLLIFQEDRRRAKIRAIHTLRSVVYCFDAIAWAALAMAAVLIVSVTHDRSVRAQAAYEIATILISNATVIVVTYRLAIALRNYCRVQWAYTTAILSQVVVNALGFVAVLRLSL